MSEQLILLALQQTPAIIAALKDLFHAEQPDAPVPTDAEIIAAYQTALATSLAIDAGWLSDHRDDQ